MMNEKIRVLFVDDERMILDGLRNRLRRQRKVWDMRFAHGPNEALDILKEHSFDAVVSDMRMPHMSGAELLSWVQEHHPWTARLMLSGQTEREEVIKALPLAHTFLHKPCDRESLVENVEMACTALSRLREPALLSMVASVPRLPMLSEFYEVLNGALENTALPREGVVEMLEKAPELYERALFLVQAGYFAGTDQEVKSARCMVEMLGLQWTRNAVLVAEVFAGVEALETPPWFDFQGFCQKALESAAAAARMVLGTEAMRATYTAAILRDLGEAVLAASGVDMREIERRAREEGRSVRDLEKEVCGFTHAEVSAALLALWGLPLDLVEIVAHHHNESLLQGKFSVGAAVYSVSYVSHCYDHQAQLVRPDLQTLLPEEGRGDQIRKTRPGRF